MKQLVFLFTVGLLGLGRWAANSIADPLDQWSLRPSGTTNALRAITCGNNQLVAVGDAGTILTSPDGLAWTERASGTADNLYGATYGNKMFVAVGGLYRADSEGVILTSPDGHNWTRILSSLTTNVLYGVCYGNGTFVAVGGLDGAPLLYPDLILTSPDGIRWTHQVSPTGGERFTGALLSSIAYGNNVFVAVGSEFVFVSPSWPIYSRVGRILTSPDGVRWIRQTGVGTLLLVVAYGNDLFLTPDDNSMFVSPDAITWTPHSLRSMAAIRAIASGNAVFVAAGDGGKILTSPDGNQWSNRISGTSNSLNGVAYGSDSFVAVGDAGTIIQSAPRAVAPFLLSGKSASGGFELIIAGTIGQAYAIQSADDLSGSIPWQTQVTWTLTNSPATWSDTTATNGLQRFYRAVTRP